MSEVTDNKTVRRFTFRGFLRCLGKGIEWLFIIVLAEVLIVGAIFHIPLKVFLLFLSLIALAFLPRRIRKYNYIPVILVVTACNIWILVPDHDRTWSPYTFDAELAEMESQYNIADEDNAASIYEQLVDKHKDAVFHPNIEDFGRYNLDFSKPFSTEDYPELSMLISDKQETIALLLEAAEYDRCHFSIPADMTSVKEQQLRLFFFKCFCRLLLQSANNDIGDGRFDQAVEKQLAVLRIADHLYQQQTLLDNSAAAYIELTAIRHINTFVMRHCDDPAIIDRIASQLKLTDDYFPANWDNIYKSLNLIVKNMVGMLYEIHPDGRIRRSHNIATTVNRQFRAGMRISPFQMTIVKAGAIGHWFVLPSTVGKAASMIDSAFAEYSPANSEDFSMPPRPELRLNFKHVTRRAAHYSAKWYYSIETQSKARTSASRAGTIIAAVRKYYLQNDEYPDSLEQLVTIDPVALTDSVNGQGFIYRKTDEDFVLYSTGGNLVDDGGVKVPILNLDDVRAWPLELEKLK